MNKANKILWQPSPEKVADSQMTTFRNAVNEKFNLDLNNYHELYNWSVEHIPDFWGFFWQYADIIHSASFTDVVDDLDKMPGAKWFSGARLNFAENLLRFRDDRTALIFRGEDMVKRELSYGELYVEVERLAHALRTAGVTKGNRVAGFLPNMPEAVIAMLASASIGALWSSSSPDFGIQGVLDRFSQIEPKIIFAADGYFFKGKRIDTQEKLRGILDELPSVGKVVIVNYTGNADTSLFSKAVSWQEFLPETAPELQFEQLPFDHPLYIMYSSGTTGKPKSIVHSAGGCLIQHLKELRLHCDLRREDKIFYFTTCGWMMWNWLVSSLAVGATVVLYDGHPLYPEPDSLLKLTDKIGISIFGTSAKYIAALEDEGVAPADISKFPKLWTILSTGSPLNEESFDYVYSKWKADVQLSSISGGTDIVSCFALGNPVLPVYRGELQCRGLGMKVKSFTDNGVHLANNKGELVCTRPFPSMPVFFWNDPDGAKYHSTYFDTYPNTWRHGDYITINDNGGVQIFGRSDATMNPGGVRIGTAEIYRVVEAMPEIADSVVVGQRIDGDERVLLFVKLIEGESLTADLNVQIKSKIRSSCSPRHVPAIVLAVADIPYTINGKKVEVAVKKIIHSEDVSNQDAMANPQALECFKNLPELSKEVV